MIQKKHCSHLGLDVAKKKITNKSTFTDYSSDKLDAVRATDTEWRNESKGAGWQ